MDRQKGLALAALLAVAVPLLAADPDGAALYKQHCASCHDNSAATRAPAPSALHLMPPENIVRTLESGAMKAQGSTLSGAERQALAAFLGKAEGSPSMPAAAMCMGSPEFSASAPAWNGWGADLGNTRFQSEKTAGLTAAQVPNLELKWAFAFPGTFTANGQPTVVGGRVFVASANRKVYSLDARSGCQYWAFEPEAPVRTAIVIAGKSAFFGDARANAYAIDASTGSQLWKVHVDGHPRSKIVGTPVVHDGKVFVPVTAGEEAAAMSPAYECCSGRGSLVALEAATGKQLWKTYTIPDEPHITGKTKTDRAIWGPSGASIWSAPTIDAERQTIYVGTGDNFSDPPTTTSDAVMALDLNSGKVLWVKQLTAGDAFNMACSIPSSPSCPESKGPDLDIGASPILLTAANGKRVLLVSQKSGVARALDPDNKGEILWEERLGHGGALGGLQWGAASDGKNLYAALSDISFSNIGMGPGGLSLTPDSEAGGGLFAIDIVSGKRVWSAPPPSCEGRPHCSPAQSAAITAIPGVVFSGSVDGHLRAYSAADGKVIWDFDTVRDFQTVNGVPAKGGSMDGPGPTVAGGMLFVGSGYGAWGGAPGNVLLAFEAK